MPTPLEIIRGVAQAAANAYDGALTEDGEPLEIGLSREEGHLVKDSRLIDGFKIKFHGPILRVNYQSDVKLAMVSSLTSSAHSTTRPTSLRKSIRE